MRINRFIAQATGLSRRTADEAITRGDVLVNGRTARLGDDITPDDEVRLRGNQLHLRAATTLMMLNKPAGYVCSRQGQGSQTVYELLPAGLQHLKPVGRLDKDSTGLLLLTDNGQLANQLTHPRFGKQKVYEVTIDKPLSPTDKKRLEEGVQLDDGISTLQLSPYQSQRHWQVSLSEGRNRQIRRSFTALGYTVTGLHRTKFGPYKLGALKLGKYTQLEP